MSTEENKAISNRIGEAIDARDFATMKELMAPNFYEEFEQGISEVYAAFPDYHRSNLIDQIAEGDKVAQHCTYYGTHLGPFMGIPPTGKQVTFNVMSIDQFADGKLIASGIATDMLEVMQQLGVVLPPGQAS